MMEHGIHRKFAVDLFNQVGTLLDKEDRSEEEDLAMIHAAHASLHHWRQIGAPLNFARGEWQVSRVYCVLKRPEAALFHARQCLAICLKSDIGDFDRAFAYEAMARALAIADRRAKSREQIELARVAGDKIKKKEDRDYFSRELATVPGYEEG